MRHVRIFLDMLAHVPYMRFTFINYFIYILLQFLSSNRKIYSCLLRHTFLRDQQRENKYRKNASISIF